MRAFSVVLRMGIQQGNSFMPVKKVKDLDTQFEALLKDAAREPVRIQKDGADVGVVLSPEHFRALTRPSSRL